MRKELLTTWLALLAITSYIVFAKSAFAGASGDNTWASKAAIPESDGGMKAAVVNGKIYVIGGSLNYEYDPATNNWTAKTPMPTPRSWFAIAACQNKIYTIGGRAFPNSFNTNEVYDPSTDTWESLQVMPTNISDVEAHAVNGKIYVIGGANEDVPSFSLNLVYNVAENTWSNKSIMPYPVTSYASTVVDSKIYIMSGSGFSLNGQTQIYDTKTDSWSLGTPIPTNVDIAAAGVTTGAFAPKRIYVLGGHVHDDFIFPQSGSALTQVYDPYNDSWTVGAEMPIARLGHTIAVVNDKIYVISGLRMAAFSPPLKDVDEYTPFGYATELETKPPTPAPSLSISVFPTNSTDSTPNTTPTPSIPEFPSVTILPICLVVALLTGFYLTKKQFQNKYGSRRHLS